MTPPDTSRRGFLAASLAAGAGMFLGFAIEAEGADEDEYRAHYLKIMPDDQIIITSAVAEIGQGTGTGLAMIVADALDADWSRIRVDLAPVGKEFINPFNLMQLTGASRGITGFRDSYRHAGAMARTMLLLAASQRWNVPVSALRTEAGRVIGPGRDQALRYGELAGAAGRLPLPKTPLPQPGPARHVGKPLPRLDTKDKIDGSAKFAADLHFPGIVYAAVAVAPVFGSKLLSDNRADVLAQKGVRGVVDLANGVAIVADKWWTARRHLELLAPQWRATPHDGQSDETIFAQFERDLARENGILIKREGEGADALARADKVIERRYRVPFLAHATMEPMSCVAKIERGRCDFWVGSQNPQIAQAKVAAMLGWPEERVTFHPVIAGGGFGRRQETDVIEQAVTIARQFEGLPVKLIWTREEDIGRGVYWTAGISQIRGGLRDRKLDAYSHRQVCQAVMPRLYPGAMEMLKKEYDFVATDAIDSLYHFPHHETRWVRSETHVPIGMWRSVGASQTVFAIESFIDEVAHEIGADPFAMRRGLLGRDPRAVALLDRLGELSGWSGRHGADSAIGLAISHKEGDCLVAQSAQVSVRDGQLVVQKICTVADPGEVINPDAVRAQLEGAAIWGLSSALWGRIRIADGQVRESNFHDYRVVRLSEAPQFVTDIMAGGGQIEGVGEGGAPGIAPALCNAIFRLTGKRIRSLPIMEQFL